MAEAGQQMESGSFEVLQGLQIVDVAKLGHFLMIVLNLLQIGWQVPVSGLVGPSAPGQPTEAGRKDCCFEIL
jgi:hypothetical protein